MWALLERIAVGHIGIIVGMFPLVPEMFATEMCLTTLCHRFG